MHTPHFSFRALQKTLATLLLLPFLTAFSVTGTANATSVSDLQQQQAALEQQAQQAQQQAIQQQTLAQRAANSLQQVTSQITQVSQALNSTQQQLQDVQSQISEKNQEVDKLDSDLRSISDQQNALVRELYILSLSKSQDLALFSSQPTAEAQEQEEQFSTLKQSVAAVYAKTQDAKTQAEKARTDLTEKNNDLASLQSQQQDQQRTLGDAQSTQQALQNNAEAAQQQLEAKASAAQAQAAQIAQKVRILLTTTNWGSQIISSDDNSWYYTQTGDNTRIGYTSETVNNIGCLITSIAMVSTFYGTRVTPDYMATHASFDSEGSYYLGTPSNLGVRLQPSGAVNWAVVQAQVAQNHPVIVSIYLPSVGALNSDGSSHFVVIKGYVDGKYLMHDPIGNGRSYNLNQVRSMILTSPN